MCVGVALACTKHSYFAPCRQGDPGLRLQISSLCSFALAIALSNVKLAVVNARCYGMFGETHTHTHITTLTGNCNSSVAIVGLICCRICRRPFARVERWSHLAACMLDNLWCCACAVDCGTPAWLHRPRLQFCSLESC